MLKSNQTKSVVPFLRWAGSKRQLLPVLGNFWNGKFERYVEPFAGSACLFFDIKPDKALLGDINQDLIFTYKRIARNVLSVIKELRKLNKSADDYYKIRSLKPDNLHPDARAARFIYLNRYCFNGLYRTNGNGDFNVPYCGDTRGVMPDDSVFIAASKVLKNADLQAQGYADTLKQVRKGDFVYMDPPFSVRSGEIFNSYDRSRFSREDIMQLRKWMLALDKKGISFVVSYTESEEADLLKKGFYYKTVSVRRSIAGFTSKRKQVNEVMIYNHDENC